MAPAEIAALGTEDGYSLPLRRVCDLGSLQVRRAPGSAED